MAHAVAELFAEGGPDTVSIENTAAKLTVSRATLYRSVSSKEQLLGILFEHTTRELADSARRTLGGLADPAARLHRLVGLHVDAAVRMRHHLPRFFDEPRLRDVGWWQQYEQLWQRTVADAIADGVLRGPDPALTSRLLLSMCTGIARWYEPDGPRSTADIAAAVITLVETPVQSTVDC